MKSRKWERRMVPQAILSLPVPKGRTYAASVSLLTAFKIPSLYPIPHGNTRRSYHVDSAQARLDRSSGRPTSPMSGLRKNPASAQPSGLSAVKERSSKALIPNSVNTHKALIPRSLGAGLALTPDEAFGWGQATFLPMRRVTYPFIFTFV